MIFCMRVKKEPNDSYWEDFYKKCCIPRESCTIYLFDISYLFCTMKQSDLVWWDTVAEKQLLIWPMISRVAGDGWNRQWATVAVAKIAMMKENVDTIIQIAAQKPVAIPWQKSDRSILDVLKWSYIVKEPWKWSLHGDEIQAVRDFVYEILNQIQFSDKEPKVIVPANEEQFMAAA